MTQSFVGRMNNKEDTCLMDSATTHTILRDKRYFYYLVMNKADVITISGSTKLTKGSERAVLSLPGGTTLAIDDALYCSKSQRNLLRFKDIRHIRYHVEIVNEGNVEYLYITTIKAG